MNSSNNEKASDFTAKQHSLRMIKWFSVEFRPPFGLAVECDLQQMNALELKLNSTLEHELGLSFHNKVLNDQVQVKN